MRSKRSAAVALCAAGFGTVLLAPSVALAATTPVYPNTPPTTTGTNVTGSDPTVLGVTITTPTLTTPTVTTPTVTTTGTAPVVADPTVTTKPSLPFTGLDTISLVAVGGVLIAGGSAVTVAARKRRAR